jgi:hypothetical protein
MQTPALPPTKLTHPGSGQVVLAVESEASQEHTATEVLSHFHPLVRWIVDCHRTNEEPFFPTSAVEIRTSLLPKGDYLCAIEFWSFFGLRKEVQIAYSIAMLDGDQSITSVAGERLVREILSTGRTWEFASRVVDPARLLAAWQVCVDRLSSDRENAFNTFQQKTVAASQRRKAHLEGYARRKEETLLKAISTSEERGLPESKIKAFRTQLINHRAAIDSRLRILDQESKPRDEFKEVAVVLCHVLD